LIQEQIDNEIKDRKEGHNNLKEEMQQQESRLDKYHEILNDQKHKIQTIDDQLGELKFEQERKPSQPVHVTYIGNPNNDSNITKFQGHTQYLHEYLGKVKRNFDKMKLLTPQSNTRECLIEIIENSLEKGASQWWQLAKHTINNWEDAEQAFLNKYWNKEIQRHIRQRMEVERYIPGGRPRRAEHFIERVVTLKCMTPTLTDIDIINYLTPHFDELIQTAQRVQNITSIHDFELLLQKEDMLEVQRDIQTRNRPRPEFQLNKNPPKKEQYDAPFQARENFRAYNRNHNTDDQHRPETRFDYHRPFGENHRNQGYQNQPGNRNSRSYNNRYPSREQAEICNMIRAENHQGNSGHSQSQTFNSHNRDNLNSQTQMS